MNFETSTQEPIYIQIKRQIIQMIADGTFTEGDSLPSVRNLASYLDVNMHTVNKSYSLLKEEGFINIEPGRGAFVRIDLKKSNENFKESLSLLFNALGPELKLRGISKDEVVSIFLKESVTE
ncbi:MAG: GntR family transcriptional regulator [Clostridium sp.]|uniref:GntR family transcriptional regulator n=1 Tax=Clostridium sp. TaxID=1506 RepID=UPI003F2D0C0E